jgi:hypothetical protein
LADYRRWARPNRTGDAQQGVKGRHLSIAPAESKDEPSGAALKIIGMCAMMGFV